MDADGGASPVRPIRILFVSDTHIGLDSPIRPRIDRRRRGDDFLASFELALAPALAGIVAVVVHGGDLLDHPRVSVGVVERALAPLRRVADAGIPVLLVPGNHERSQIPYPLLAAHPRIHVFRAPSTHVVECRGGRFAFAGFPYYRRGVRRSFRELCAATRLDDVEADARVMCMHHCVEGATCGPGDFTFRSQPDVVRCEDLPSRAAIVLSGHVHRHQVVRRDLAGRPLRAPVLYAGSVERTSFAEKDETKGYVLLAIAPDRAGVGRVVRGVFRSLPARPMVLREIVVEPDTPADAIVAQIEQAVAAAPPDALLRLRLLGVPAPDASRALSATSLRSLAPPTMNVSIAWPRSPQAGVVPVGFART